MNNQLSIKKPAIFRRLSEWVKQHRALSIVIASVVFLVIASSIAYFIFSRNTPHSPNYAVAPKPLPKPVYYSPLTGEKVKDEAATKQAVTAIMLENSPDARPQSGLKQAGIVYEAIAEGGITRFLTLHQQDKPQMIGPVRSLRMYYVDWLAPYQASVAHVGGSAAALAEIRNGKYRDIDQFFNGAYYWRATDRWAPHNVYTSFDKLDELNKSKGYTESTFTAFQRKDGKAAENQDATNITINFSGDWYNTKYTYDAENNQYSRFLAGEPHMDREDGAITPKVIVALKVNETRVMEDGYRESIETIGSGEAIIFQNGTATKATWHKPDRFTHISLKDENNTEIPLVRGQTWIAAVPNGHGEVIWE
jgi:hypothetical protein